MTARTFSLILVGCFIAGLLIGCTRDEAQRELRHKYFVECAVLVTATAKYNDEAIKFCDDAARGMARE